jgi:glycosyltransferase involved in cell wall biosynthesis
VSRPQLNVLAAGGTPGWAVSADELAAALARCGVAAAVVPVPRPREVRTFALTDLMAALAARRAAQRLGPTAPIIYCSVTAALLWPRPGAIWLDTLAAENRPGRHGVWQRPVERRRLAQAPLVMTMGPGTVPGGVAVPVPVEASGPSAATRDIAAVTYVGDPAKKRTSLVIEAWRAARREGETLVVAGGVGVDGPGVRWVGRLPRDEYRALLRRARVFVAAPRIEDYGTAPLEALADGCALVTIASTRGPYPARAIAREVDPRLVVADDGLSGALRVALDDPLPGYAARAAARLEPFSARAVDRVLREQVLPQLLG